MESKHLAVIGSPIAHSKSPLIHLAAYLQLGLDWDYSRAQVTDIELGAFLQTTELDALSLTMPLKQEAFDLIPTADRHAILARSINTAVRDESGAWIGYNTDVFGLSKALADTEFTNALILGSGATARNAAIVLAEQQPGASISVRARDPQKTSELIRFAESIGLLADSAPEEVRVGNYDLTISTLPPGADSLNWLTGEPNGTLIDVAYNPWPSKLAMLWQNSGGNVISGIEMLIWQAIAQIRIFRNGNVAEPLENEDELASVMRNAALAEG